MSYTIAEVRSWNDLHAAFRARAESLNVSRLVLDELSGLQSGYASKLLAPVPIRHFGRVSLGAMSGALGLKLVVQEDKEALARVAGRLVRRERNVRRRGQDASRSCRSQNGGVTPSRPTRHARPCSVPSDCLTATMKTFAPGFRSLLSPST
jgi:hypothetical protein